MKLYLLQNKIFKEPKKILILLIVVFGLILLGVKIFSNRATAQVQIIPVSVNISHLDFGTVFPGEELQGNFIVTYGTTGDGINYRIIQKPKPRWPELLTCSQGFASIEEARAYCVSNPADLNCCYPDLCSFLEKVNVDPGETDTEDQAFVGPNDLTDTWVVYFKVPAIMGQVSQDHTGGIISEEGDYGCDIAIDIDWVPPEPVASAYSPIADATVYEINPNNNYGNQTNISIKSQQTQNRRTFIRFDFHFPNNTDILSSNLKLYMTGAPSEERTYEARSVSNSWNELNPSGVNWNNQPGVSVSSTDSILSGTTANVWLDWNVTSDVQSFVAGTLTNNGWRLADANESSQSNTLTGDFFSQENGNYTHRPELDVVFTTPPATTSYLVINEVFYDAPTAGEQNEWVEIYNPTNAAVDISGWKICDNNSCDTIPASSPIPAKGYAVITADSSTWAIWPSIPAGTIKIVLGSSIGNGLANAGDRVILKNALDVVIDAMSYGSDTSQLNPSVPVTEKADDLARIVKGYDTDSETDWILNATPNPGTNPSEGGIETIRFTSEGAEIGTP